MVPTRKEAAEKLGVDERTLGRWKLEQGFPNCDSGYDIEAIQNWRDANQRRGSQVTEQLSLINAAIRAERLKEIKNKVSLQQFEIDKANKELLPRAVVHDLLMECAALIRGLGTQLQRSGNLTAVRMIDEQMDRMEKVIQERLSRRES